MASKLYSEPSSILKGKEILILEDDSFLNKRLVAMLENCGAEVTLCEEVKEARNNLDALVFDFALFDLNLPDGESLEILREGLVPANTVTILMTAEGGIDSAVEAMRLGADNYLSKPFEIDEIPILFQKADQQRKSQRLIQHGSEQRKLESANLFFEGVFEQDFNQLKKIIDVDSRLQANLPPLLIDGPTGSGKSTYARWVHDHGARQEAAFVAINCSAIPNNLIESELFGHEKGAFTDAKNARIGLFEAADNGTLFLDEIANLSLEAQAKLLLAIESGIIRRVGGTNEIKIDVRIIAAANQDLSQMIEMGTFREDLFHRLDLLRIKIPPLSSRGKDILKLSKHLLSALSKKYKIKLPLFAPGTDHQLLEHPWPGNTRELLHELERAIVMGERNQPLQFNLANYKSVKLDTDDWLNPFFRFPEKGFDLEKEVQRLLKLAIEQSNGNISEASRKLGVPRDYIRYRLKKST
jgi:DNA-binding NtrC family response regulator